MNSVFAQVLKIGSAIAALSVTTALIVTGTATFNQKSGTGNLVIKSEASMTSATTTPCSFQNTTGRVLMIESINAYEASGTSGGLISIRAGTSTGMNVTSTSPLVDTTITRQTGVTGNTVTTPSSTLSAGGPAAWEAGNWVTFKSNSTSVHSGECMLITT